MILYHNEKSANLTFHVRSASLRSFNEGRKCLRRRQLYRCRGFWRSNSVPNNFHTYLSINHSSNQQIEVYSSNVTLTSLRLLKNIQIRQNIVWYISSYLVYLLKQKWFDTNYQTIGTYILQVYVRTISNRFILIIWVRTLLRLKSRFSIRKCRNHVLF